MAKLKLKNFFSGSSRMQFIVLVTIFALALGIRTGMILMAPKSLPYYGMSIPIGEAARNLVEGRGYVIDEGYVDSIVSRIAREGPCDIADVAPPSEETFTPYYGLPPGPSILLAGTYWIFGEYRYIYLRVLQAIIDSFGCVLMFLIGRELFNRRVGLIAAFLYAIWLPIAYLSTWPLHDALMPFITLVCLYFFIEGVRRKKVIFYILSGLFTGIGCYFQPSLLLLPVAFGIGLLIYEARKIDFWKCVAQAAKVTVLMTVVLVLVISPWVVRNYHVTGAVFAMRITVWSLLWEGFAEFGDAPVDASLDDANPRAIASRELGYDVKYGTPEVEAVIRPKVLNAIKEHPLWYLSLLARRVPRAVCNFSELGLNIHPLIGTDYSAWLGYLYSTGSVGYVTAVKKMLHGIGDGSFWNMLIRHPYGTFYLGLVWFFAIVPPLLSLVAFWLARRNWRALALVAAVPVYFICLAAFTSATSYKSIVPASLGYIIFSAITINYIWGSIDRKWQKAKKLPDVVNL